MGGAIVMMSRVKKGLVAGFAATLVVFVLEAVNQFGGPWFTPFPAIVAHMIGMAVTSRSAGSHTS